MNEHEKEKLSLLIGFTIGILIYFLLTNPKIILFAFGFWIAYYILIWILEKLHKNLKLHYYKIPFLFTFLITMLVATSISLYLLDTIKIPIYRQLWPYQMTFLTLLLGWETYRMYRRVYPKPQNYTLTNYGRLDEARE